MKKCITILTAIVLCVTALFQTGSLQVQAASNEEMLAEMEENALQWLISEQNADGSFGDKRTLRDTSVVIELLNDSEEEINDEWLTKKGAVLKDNDSASRLYSALSKEEYFDVIGKANADGGYGLTESYQSDVLDTRLVLEALVRKHLTDGTHKEQADKAVQYLAKCQNADGGFSYLSEMDSDYRLTTEIGIVVAAYERYGKVVSNTDILSGIDNYIAKNEQNITSDFEAYAYGLVYRCLRGEVTDTDAIIIALANEQNSNGSIQNDLHNTVAAVRLIFALQESVKPYIVVKNMETELSANTVYVNYENTLDYKTTVSFTCNTSFQGMLKAVVYENEKVIYEKDTICLCNQNQTEIVIEDNVSIDVKQDMNYKFEVQLSVDGKLWGSIVKELYSKELSIDDLVLTLKDENTETVELSWNDISNPVYRYGYRIYRSTDDVEWETRSSWNGIEKVKVLNIYPEASARNYLSNWMETSINSENAPAGKGLFEIDKVLFDDYNRAPDSYLMDENGYKYDVLVFGTTDCNSFKDLNQLSYEATKKFADSGRGVLFGHDTISNVSGLHRPYLAKFADDLGIKLTTYGVFHMTSTVKVVNEGFLTSYPWKLSGTLNIPTSHTSGQVTGGSNEATVWMEFSVDAYNDAQTGGKANAYLCTNNQLALIQTGHSNGQATDDERKILANTLFYLKQVTNKTDAEDKSATDTQAPGVCEVNNILRDKDNLTLDVQAEDLGTKYYYYVEAVPQGMDDEILKRKSEKKETVVTSGIYGYQIAVSSSEEPCDDEAFGEVLFVENNKLTISDEVLGEATYLHIRAVDMQGNVGEETVIGIPEKEDNSWKHTGYSLFGSNGVTVYCSALKVQEDIYSGRDITFGGSTIVIDGQCNAIGKVNAYVGSIQTAAKNSGVDFCMMPDYRESILKQMRDVKTENSLNIYTSSQMEEAVYCRKTVSAYCPEITFNNSLVCEGDIRMGVSKAKLGDEMPVAVYSVNGNISINASSLSGNGIIYAPNGTVTINVAEMNYIGSIVAKEIILQGSMLKVDAIVE